MSRRTSPITAPLYAIVDADACSAHGLLEMAQALLSAGAPLLQLRMKRRGAAELAETARAVQRLCHAAHAQLIVNDRADVAKLVGAAGVHLGQDDLPPEEAREWLGPEAIIGLSTHSLAQAQAAERAGIADYIGYGPIFATATKADADPVQGLENLRTACRAVDLPVVAIGGIGADQFDSVLNAGAAAAAMIGALSKAANLTTFANELLARRR